jgi:Protein of unknown function, DUF481
MSGAVRLLAFVCVVWLPAAALAGPKLDAVQLTNGDHLTCEIKKLQQGRLTISTDALETVVVFWQDVAWVTSTREFEVTLDSGDKQFGTLGSTGAPGSLVITPYGLPPATQALADVTGIVPIGASLWSRMDGNVDLGLSVAQANNETHWTLNAGAEYRSRRYRVDSSITSQMTSREDTPRQLRNTLTLQLSRLYTNQWFATALGQIQQNDELQLQLRTVGGGGIGNAFSQTNHRFLAGFAGLVYTHEQFVDQPLDNSAEIAVGGQIDFFTAAKQEHTLTNSIVTYYRVTGDSRARIELQSAWRHEFLSDFYWSLNGVESFDSHPPPEKKKNDFSLSLAIGWSF